MAYSTSFGFDMAAIFGFYLSYCSSVFDGLHNNKLKKILMQTSTCRDGTLKKKLTKFTPSLHLVPFCQLSMDFFFSYGHTTVVNGSGVGV